MTTTTDLVLCYSELIKLKTLEERFEYLKQNGIVGEELFGYQRYLTQIFYHSGRWIKAKSEVIIRDHGCELGVPGWEIQGNIYVHHMNRITEEQLLRDDPILYDPENLISCGYNVHQAITWGNKDLLPKPLIIRRPNDTCPWKA